MSKARHESSSSPPSIRERVKFGAVTGLFFAALGLLIGAARIGLALFAGRRFPFGARDALLLLSYPVGFIVAGSVVGGLWPLRRRFLGAIMLGVLGAALFYATILIAWKPDLLSWRRDDWILLALCSVPIGSFFGYKFWKDR